MEAIEELSRKRGDLQIHVRYRKTRTSQVVTLVEGKDYLLSNGQILMQFTPPKGSMIGIRRTGENEKGIFDHTTWMPSSKTHEKTAKPLKRR